ncbi:MAG: hypothetical protein ACLFUE_00920 [Desulfobacteraceae bacterium]
MNISFDDLSALVFKRVPVKNLGKFSLDGEMLGVLMEVDGKKTAGSIARALGMDMGPLRRALAGLMELGLVEAGEDSLPVVDDEFLDYLKKRLSLAVGPIAEVLIEDAAADLGYDPEKFPKHRAAELVELLSRQIRREDRKAAFKQGMVEMIRVKGY